MKTKPITHTALCLCLAAFSSLVSAQDTQGSTISIQEKAPQFSGSLTTVIGNSNTFSTLSKVLVASGLDVTLAKMDEFTIFAPTDEAFSKLPSEMLSKLLLPENKEKLRMLLLYHVLSGKMLAGDFVDGDVKTVSGERLKISVTPEKIEVEGENVYTVDMTATNGVMHTIGTVLMPKSMDGFVGL